MAATLAVVVKGWPRLSETFIARELLALEAQGLALEIWSLRHPTDRHVHPMVAALKGAVRYLPEYLWHEPLRVWRGWRKARRLPGYRAARRQFLADWRRDLTPNRLRRFGQACVLAAELPAETRLLYAHFLHTPASVARYAGLMRGLAWSVSAHAKDIWTTPAWEKREKLAAAAFCVTCTASGAEHLAALAPPGRVTLAHHGLDQAAFPDPGPRDQTRDGSDPASPVRLLSIGRAVEKKGYDVLLAALARLPADLHWRLVHVGGGALRPSLMNTAGRLGLAGRIEWRGAQPADAVLAAYRAADLFVLAPKVAADGDRDGLPNVLVEAASQRLALVATRVSAVPELVADGTTGMLVPPEDPDALASALASLIRLPAARARLGDAAAACVAERFVFARGIDTIATLLAEAGR